MERNPNNAPFRYNKYNEWLNEKMHQNDKGISEIKEIFESEAARHSTMLRVSTLVCSGAGGAALSVVLALGDIKIANCISLVILCFSILFGVTCAAYKWSLISIISYRIKEFERAERVLEQAVLASSISLHPQILSYASAAAESQLGFDKNSAMALSSSQLDESLNLQTKLAQSYAAGLVATRINDESIRKAIKYDVDFTVGSVRNDLVQIFKEMYN